MTLSEYMNPLLERANTLYHEMEMLRASDDTQHITIKTKEFDEVLNDLQKVLNAHIVALLDELSKMWPYMVSDLFSMAYSPPAVEGVHMLALNFAGIVYKTSCKPTTQYHAMYFFQVFAAALNGHFESEQVPVYIFVGIDDTIEESEE